MARGKKVPAPPRCCWGAQIQCVSAEWCSPNFVAGARHFKTKFCCHCRQETAVPMERVRALREERKRLRKEHKFGRKTIRSDGQELATAEEQASDPSMVE